MFTVRPMGEDALLVECAPEQVVGVYRSVAAADLPRVLDIVPGAQSVLVRFADGIDLAPVRRRLADLAPATVREGDRRHHLIETTYDGVDLDEVGRMTGLGVDGVIRAHTQATWTVAFLGFAPGFAYLRSDDPRLRVPRHAAPRTGVPAGSVALAGEFGGIYPRSSPGGWQLVGHTDTSLWDLAEDHPALLAIGDRVRFRRIG